LEMESKKQKKIKISDNNNMLLDQRLPIFYILSTG
jgi:hypothetical protein